MRPASPHRRLDRLAGQIIPKGANENGEENQENLEEGSFQDQEGRGQGQGVDAVTPFERRERRADIEGEIKQVLALIQECKADEANKAAILATAGAATLKQRQRLSELMDEVDSLAAETQADWLSLKELAKCALPQGDFTPQDEAEFAERVQHPAGQNAVFHGPLS